MCTRAPVPEGVRVCALSFFVKEGKREWLT